MQFRNRRFLASITVLLSVTLLLAACGRVEAPTSFDRLSMSVELDLAWALRGEVVTGKLQGANGDEVKWVTVGGVAAQVTEDKGNRFAFPVPDGAPAGRQAVVIEVKSTLLEGTINVLGDDVEEREFLLQLEPGTSESDLAEALEGIEYQLVEGPYSLGIDAGPCSGERVKLRISGMGTGAALTELKGRTGIGPILQSDPQSGYSSGTTDHLGAVGARAAHLRGIGGSGTVVAVIDTGVSDHPELGFRLLHERGHDFVDEGTPPLDEFAGGGHGTPIAVLAAGSRSGVAPQASVLPVRVCDENGVCYSDDVLNGICHALATSERHLGGMDRLVINLSLGGETPVESIREALEYALANGALVAASGGNLAAVGSPRHYPAAFDLDGVVAVAALHATANEELAGEWRPASFSTRGAYLDISAPGTDLTSGTSGGHYRSDFTGTSYATAMVAGALALWRDAYPSLTAAEVEAGMEAAAKDLPYPENAVGAGMLDLSREPR